MDCDRSSIASAFGPGGRASRFAYQPTCALGYLTKGAKLADLARATGIDPAGLEAAVERFNRHAREGCDPDFGRGSNAYDLWAGDPSHGPCPCLGPLETPPFYAMRVFAGSVGTFAGLVTNRRAQVLDVAMSRSRAFMLSAMISRASLEATTSPAAARSGPR